MASSSSSSSSLCLLLSLLLLASSVSAQLSSSSRKLSGYDTGSGSHSSSSGSSPVSASPLRNTPSYGSPSSGSSSSPSSGSSSSSPSSGSSSSSPSSGSSSSSPSSGSSSSPVVNLPPITSTPSPVTSTPTTGGGFGGYGSHSGHGTCKYWGANPGGVPRILSLVASIARIFGPRLLKFFVHKPAPTVYGALKDTSSDPISALAREASASLINSYKYRDFPLSTGEVVAQFNSALDSPDLASAQAMKFQSFNEAM